MLILCWSYFYFQYGSLFLVCIWILCWAAVCALIHMFCAYILFTCVIFFWAFWCLQSWAQPWTPTSVVAQMTLRKNQSWKQDYQQYLVIHASYTADLRVKETMVWRINEKWSQFVFYTYTWPHAFQITVSANCNYRKNNYCTDIQSLVFFFIPLLQNAIRQDQDKVHIWKNLECSWDGKKIKR